MPGVWMRGRWLGGVYWTSRVEGSQPAKKIRRDVKGESVNAVHECDVDKMYAVCHVS
jgi:hypothetical protein